MALAVASNVNNFTDGNTTVTFVVPGMSAGDGMVLELGLWNNGLAGDNITVTDSAGNTWALADNGTTQAKVVGGAYAALVYYCAASVAGGSITVTVTSANSGYFRGSVQRITGASGGITPDQIVVNAQTAASTATTGTTGTTTSADEVAVAVSHSQNGGGLGLTYTNPPSGWTAAETNNGGGGSTIGLASCYKVLTATGTESASWPLGVSCDTQNVLVTFKAAGGSGIAGNAQAVATATGDLTTVSNNIAYVGGATVTFAGDTSSAAISIPALTGGIGGSIQQNDLVLVSYAVGTSGRNPTLSITGNNSGAYTQRQNLSNTAGTTYDTKLCTYHQFMGATPDTQITRAATGNAADAGAISIRVYRNVDPTTPFDVADTTANGASTGRPDPPSITPTTVNSWVVAVGAGAAATGATFTSSDLSAFHTANSADTNDGTIGAGHIAQWASGAVNPAGWTGGSTNAANSWLAVTMALRPKINSGGAAALAGNAQAVATAGTAALLVPKPLAGAAQAVATAGTAALLVPKPLAGAAQAVVTAAGDITTQVLFAGAAQAVATAGAAALDVPKPLAGAAQAVVTATGDLTTSTTSWAGAAQAVATAGPATLDVPKPLVGSAYAVASATATLSVPKPLAGAAQAVATAGAAALSVPKPLAGAAQAVATATGTLLVGAAALAGAAQAQATATGALTTQVRFAGAAQVQATAAAALTTQIRFAGAAQAVVTAAATLLVPKPLAGAAVAQATAAAALTTQIRLAGAAQVVVSAAGTLSAGYIGGGNWALPFTLDINGLRVPVDISMTVKAGAIRVEAKADAIRADAAVQHIAVRAGLQ